MPEYKFKNNDTGEEFVTFMRITELDDYLVQNPQLTQMVYGAPMIVSGRGMAKPDSSFRDVLKEIKKKNSRGISKSTINTF